jgi:hypothetical protein
MTRPAMRCRPASMTGGSVEPSMIGRVAQVAKRAVTSATSATPSSPVWSTHTSRTWAPPLTASRAMTTQVSQSSASMASRNYLEPLALVRSPTTRNDGDWS